MRIDKYKSKSLAELNTDLQEKKVKLHAYQLDIKSGKEKDTAKVKYMRKDIARISTISNIKQITGEVLKAVEEKIETPKLKEKAEVKAATEEVKVAKKEKSK